MILRERPLLSLEDETRVIGWIATRSARHVFRHGDACVIAGSRATLERYLASKSPDLIETLSLSKTRFGEVLHRLGEGAAYAFDEAAYERFYPLARRAGIDLSPEDFPPMSDTEFHFVKVTLEG